jgi:hypothetical protein
MRQKPTSFACRARYRRGVAITEALVAVALMVVTCGLAYQQVSGVHREGTGLSSSEGVKMLNKSLATYLHNGGTIPPGTTANALLTKMKKRAAETKEGTFAGLKGPFVDVRLVGLPAAADSTGQRIVWNAESWQFSLATTGAGWSSLRYDAEQALVDYGTEARTCMHNFAQENCWVWDYADAPLARRNPNNIPVADPLVGQLALTDDLLPLAPPVINPRSGVFDHRDFPLSLTIANSNTASASDVLYQINGGAWQVWLGGTSPVEKSLTTTISTYAQAREMTAFTDSAIVTETYISYFMRGQSGGVFINQTGDKQFVYSLNSGGSSLSWGKTESAGQAVSSLEFIPGSTFEAGAGESFELGNLRYFNGLTRAGTNAQTATVRLDLALSVPSTGTISLNIPVRMLNSIHYPWTPVSEYVDYLWVPQYLALSQPITILDRQFAVSIMAQASSAVVEGTEIKVPIGENATADVKLVATVTAL